MKLKRLLYTAITFTILLGSTVAAESSQLANIETAIAMHSGFEEIEQLDYQIVVEGKTLVLPKGVVPALRGKGDVLIPLRAVGEALGYDITWNDERKVAHLDMSIASMDFPLGQSTYYRKGKLQVINLDMDYPMDDGAKLIDGVIYIPLQLFEVFLNDVVVDRENQIIFIEARKANIQ